MLYPHPLHTDDPLRLQLRRRLRAPEAALLQELLPLADPGEAVRSRIGERARDLVAYIRREQAGRGGVDALLQEFSLSTDEGVVLMCLAEALLRVPDPLTADRLIRDKLSAGDWSAHLGHSESLFVNASAWGLLLTGRVIDYGATAPERQFGQLRRTLGRLGEPVIRAAVRYAMKVMGTQFVLGTDIGQAMARAREPEARGYRHSYDMLGEGARTRADADRHFEAYLNAIEAVAAADTGPAIEARPGVSVKLSALHPRFEFGRREQLLAELAPRLRSLALAAADRNVGFSVDAEEADRLEPALDLIEAVFGDAALGDWGGFGIVIQAYQRRAPALVDWAHALARRVGRRLMVRLVKGAYWDAEIKRDQVRGLPDYPVFTRKAATDLCFQACARRLLAARDHLYPQFATHNAVAVAAVLALDDSRQGYEFQRLHGMGELLYERVLDREGVPCRIYAPVGVHADLLGYLVRRLLENGSNSSFVNNIVDESIEIEDLIRDPVEEVRGWREAHNPRIPLPADLYGPGRRNAAGMDLCDPPTLEAARAAMVRWLATLPLDHPGAGELREIRNPADREELLGRVRLADAAAMEAAVAAALAAFGAWSATPVADRAALLSRVADALEAHRDELMALCCKEAGKTVADSLAEVREAVDFCRYYAVEARSGGLQDPELRPRGVVLCISPWNFPLAIFLGQVAAALVAGNTVVAKPAEQTCLIALRTLALMRTCGLPEGALRLLVAEGPPVGARLVPDPRIRAVMFTGSTATGAWLARTLAGRADAPVPLIAETGGQNCMVVDSTALPEQVVDDVISSGFRSAGQRCSALRVLFLQEEIADEVIAMLIGAMRELQVGDPSLLATDVGPVIDQRAQARLQAHVDYLAGAGRLLYACRAPAAGPHTFFAPRLYEISNLSLLPGEVFGPIVHVIRYPARARDAVYEQVNRTGYGLTFGMHSRIEGAWREAAQRVRAGNIYVNRNMIGAIVGVQPFGGRGLSGTGPKAGGPHYLPRLCRRDEDTGWAATQRPLPAPEAESSTPPADATRATLPVTERIQLLGDWLGALATLSGAARPPDACLAAAREQLDRAGGLLAAPLELPGPTGESNTLVLEPRGALLVLLEPAGEALWNLLALVSALAAGNTVHACVAPTLADDWEQRAAVPAGSLLSLALAPLAATAPLLRAPGLVGAIVHPGSAHLRAVAQLLAARTDAPGGAPILPLIHTGDSRDLLLQCLLEKCVSVDTTAGGGNAELLARAGERQTPGARAAASGTTRP